MVILVIAFVRYCCTYIALLAHALLVEICSCISRLVANDRRFEPAASGGMRGESGPYICIATNRLGGGLFGERLAAPNANRSHALQKA